MKEIITLEKAKEIALAHDPEYNLCEEYTDAFVFILDDGQIRRGGPHTGVVVLKADGSTIPPYEYFLGDKYKGKSTGKTYNIK